MNWLQRLYRGKPLTPAPAPADAEGWLRAGYECESQGDPAAAERLYRRVIASDPLHADAPAVVGAAGEGAVLSVAWFENLSAAPSPETLQR